MIKHRAHQASLSTAVSAVAETEQPDASTEATGCARGQIGRPLPGKLASGLGRRPATVLVVEEGPFSLMMLNAALVEASFEVIPAHSVADALIHVESGSARPNAMMINMEASRPDSAQVGLVSLARRRWPELAVLALLATSADIDPGVSGMPNGTRTMTGPIVLEDLVDNLQALLASRGNIGLQGQAAVALRLH